MTHSPTPDERTSAKGSEMRTADQDLDDSPSVIGGGSHPAPMPTPDDLASAILRTWSEIPVTLKTSELVALTSYLDEHPEWWDGPCLCATCRSYCDE